MRTDEQDKPPDSSFVSCSADRQVSNLTWAACGAGAAVFALGLTVIIGWHIKMPAIIQLNPAFVPMQYNTAIGFLLSGAAILLAAFGCRKWIIYPGMIISLIGMLTLIEYLFALSLGIDELFMKHYISVATSHPGRMAPNTALNFFMIGTALVLIGLDRYTLGRLQSIALLVAVTLGLSAVSLLGYLANIPAAYGWGRLTRMAVHTSAGFIILGIGLGAITWRLGRTERAWLPIALSVTAATVSISLWQALKSHIHEQAVGVEDDLVLVFGLLMAIALYLITALAKKTELAASAAEAANDKFLVEIYERKKVEEELKEYRDQLEHMVAERTTELETSNRKLSLKIEDLKLMAEERRRNDTLQAVMYFISEIGLRIEDLDVVCRKIVEKVGETTDFPMVAIELHDEQRQKMVFKAVTGFKPPKGVETLEIPVAESLSGKAVRSGNPVIVSNALELPEYSNEFLRSLNINTFLSLPMSVHNKIIGTLSLAHTKAFQVDDQLLQWLQGLANYIAALINRKQAEAEIERLYINTREYAMRLEALNKELETFTYSASHVLKTPLRCIHGFSQVLLEECGGRVDEEGRRMLKIVSTNAVNMGQYLDDMLEYSDLGKKQVSPSLTDMDKAVKAVIAELNPLTYGRNVQFDIKPLWPVPADKDMLHVILRKLLSNALKFTRPKMNARIAIGGKNEKGLNIFYVKDNGIGFDMRYANKLFVRFQHLHGDEELKGTGMGLAVVKRLVEKHNGRVWAEGVVNEGATFYFALPDK